MKRGRQRTKKKNEVLKWKAKYERCEQSPRDKEKAQKCRRQSPKKIDILLENKGFLKLFVGLEIHFLLNTCIYKDYKTFSVKKFKHKKNHFKRLEFDQG